jgi:methylenetetrahydrofolate dehydrogenase (NADP+)/methenyltetrahydrofolate cyclohydrolase
MAYAQTVNILRGSSLAKSIRETTAREVQELRGRGIFPTLAVVIATADASAHSYVNSIQKAASALSIVLKVARFSCCTQQQLESALLDLSSDGSVHGIILQLPLFADLDTAQAIMRINPLKDVDGLTPQNMGLLLAGKERSALLPATPQACVELAETLGTLSGTTVGIVGRGRTVGRPLLAMAINRHATVTVCHTRTRDLKKALAPCDIIFVAIGKPNAITANHFSDGQLVIDAGINMLGESVVGDVDASDSMISKLGALSAVPGGVGPITTAILFRNLLRAISLQTTHK